MSAVTTLNQDEALFVSEIEKFAQSRLNQEKVLEMDEKEHMDPAVIQDLFEMGLMGVEIPVEHGGAGGSFFMAALAVEALAKYDPSVSVLMDVQNTLVNNIFINYASKELQEKYLPQLAASKVGAYCLTEPNSGSDAFAMASRAYDEGDHYRIEGKKIFITNAKEASVFVYFANLNPEAGYKGITAFVIEEGTPGFRIGKKEVKMGIRASSTCEVIAENVKIPKSQLVGEEGKGYKIAIGTLNEGRIGIAAQMLGLAQGAFNAALKYSREREQFGKSLDKFQAIQFQLAEMAIEIQSARLHVYNAAKKKDAGEDFVNDAAMAKYYASQVGEKVASSALEIFGGYGFIKEFPAEKFYRDAKIGKLYEGTSNMQLSTIFKSL